MQSCIQVIGDENVIQSFEVELEQLLDDVPYEYCMKINRKNEDIINDAITAANGGVEMKIMEKGELRFLHSYL